MKQVLPIIIICSVGIAVCLVLLGIIAVRAIKRRLMRAEYDEMELDDDVLTISLKKKHTKSGK